MGLPKGVGAPLKGQKLINGKWQFPGGAEAKAAPSSTTTSASKDSKSSSPEQPGAVEAAPSLPPPRKTKEKKPKTNPLPDLSTYRKVPEDEKEREEALSPYKFYARMMAGAMSKAYDVLSDMPLDKEERECAIEAFSLMCYQMNLTMLDWRISVGILVASTASTRAPAAYQKWFGEKKVDTTMTQEREKAEPKPVEGLRLTPVPDSGVMS